jgi:hypothetical protein
VVWSLALAGYAAYDQDWTTDEPMHLGWSERFWKKGETERDSLARYDSKTPIQVLNVMAREAAIRQGHDDDDVLRRAARAPHLVWLIALYAGTWGLARRLGGPTAAWFAVLVVSLDPNMAAHASVITSDLPFAAGTAMSLWAALSCRQDPGARRALALGVAVGVALVAKFSAVLLVPFAFGIAFAHRRASPGRAAALLTLAAAASWLTLGAAYGFDRIGAPIAQAQWKSNAFVSLAAKAPGLPAPLPMAFLEGVDRSRSSDASVGWRIVIANHVSEDPLWYFFILGWLFKTPIILTLLTLSCAPALMRFARDRSEIRWLLLHQLVVLAFFSLAFRTQLGFRFVLMLVPVTCALVAMVTATLRPRRLALLAVAVTAGTIVEVAPFREDPLAFSSALVWPKSEAYRFLGDSNIDWNQNRVRWLRFARAQGLPDNGVLNPPDLRAGLNVVSTSRMAGVVPGDAFRWARENLHPVGMAGWTHHYIDVTDDDFDRFLDAERTLEPDPSAARTCGMTSDALMDSPGIRTPFDVDVAPTTARISVLCVATRKGADVVAAVEEGRMDFAPSGRPDLQGTIAPGQQVQYRLAPGVHTFVIIETPNRRDSLRYELHAGFAAARRGALLKVVPVDPATLPAASRLRRWFFPGKPVESP